MEEEGGTTAIGLFLIDKFNGSISILSCLLFYSRLITTMFYCIFINQCVSAAH